MFNHLLEKKMTIEWEYGPVKCRKLFLQGVDVPFGTCVFEYRSCAAAVE